MTKFVKYYPQVYNRKEFVENLRKIKQSGFDGVFLSATRSWEEIKQRRLKSEFYQISRMIDIVREFGLQVGVILDCFHSPKLWTHENFSAPIGVSGVNFLPQSWYYPVCPSNPLAYERYYKMLEKMYSISTPDFFVLDFLRFPFFWETMELDVQHRIPPYCYCPFCMGEFSSEVGEIVSSLSQIDELMPEWLEWRNQVIYDFFRDAKDLLENDSSIIVSLPPLSLIDLPFTTGQLPMAYSDAGSYVSPLLYHSQKKKDMLWIEDILDQYVFDIGRKKVAPSFEITNIGEFEEFSKITNFQNIFLFNWTNIEKVIRKT